MVINDHPRPETALWDALVDAGPEGVSVAKLEAACGMGRSWIYYRLQAHATAGSAPSPRRKPKAASDPVPMTRAPARRQAADPGSLDRPGARGGRGRQRRAGVLPPQS